MSPTLYERNIFCDFLKMANAKNIVVIAMSGTHDYKQSVGDPFREFRLIGGYDPLIITPEWKTGVREFSPRGIVEVSYGKVGEVYRVAISLGRLSVIMAHVGIANRKPGRAQGKIRVGHDESVFLQDLIRLHRTNPLFDMHSIGYIALGHYHGMQTWEVDNTIFAYPGSLIRLTMAEREDKKGFYVVEVDNDTFSVTPRYFTDTTPMNLIKEGDKLPKEVCDSICKVRTSDSIEGNRIAKILRRGKAKFVEVELVSKKRSLKKLQSKREGKSVIEEARDYVKTNHPKSVKAFTRIVRQS